MANFRSYDRRDQDRRAFWKGVAAAGVATLVLSPAARKGVAKLAFRGLEKLGNHFRPGGLAPHQESLGRTIAQANHLLDDSGFLQQYRRTFKESQFSSQLGMLAKKEAKTGGKIAGADADELTRRILGTEHLRQYLNNSKLNARAWLADPRSKGVLSGFEAHESAIHDMLDSVRKSAAKRARSVDKTRAYKAARARVEQEVGRHIGSLGDNPSAGWGDALRGRARSAFGVERVRYGQQTHVDLSGQVSGLKKKLGTYGAGLEDDVNKAYMSQIYRIDGETYDLRGASELYHRSMNWLSSAFQIPLAPGATGINPFTLFSWRRGQLNQDITHLAPTARDATLRAHLTPHPEMYPGGIGKDVLKIGRKFFGVSTKDGTVNQIAEGLDLYSGHHGAAATRAQQIERARAAKGSPTQLFGQTDPSLLSNLKGVRGKYSADSNWIGSVYGRIMGGQNVEVQDAKALIEFLRQSDVHSLVNSGVDRAVGGGLQMTDEALIAYFNGSPLSGAAPPGSTQSKLLSDLRNRWQQNPNTVWSEVTPQPHQSIFGWNILGKKSDVFGPDSMRLGLLEHELIERLSVNGSMDPSRWAELRKLGLKGGTQVDLEGHAASLLLDQKLTGQTQYNIQEFTDTLRGNADVRESVERYIGRHAKWWHPYSESTLPNLYTGELTIKPGVSALEWMEAVNQDMKSGKGAVEVMMDQATKTGWWQQYRAFFTGAPEDVTATTLFAEHFPRKLNEYFSAVGLGLPDADLLTGWSITKNLFLKRALPAVAAYETWRYLDFEADTAHMPGPSDAWAAVKSSAGFARAELFGDGALLGDRDTLPGLEMLISDRTRQEEARHQREGWEPVRKGRGWFLGSRTPMYGERISHYAPSAVAAARSDWQGTQESDLNSYHSWVNSRIPNPANMFVGALLNWIPDKQSYWWEFEHDTTSPTIESAPAFDPQTPYGPLANATIGQIIKSRRLMHPEYVPRHLGGDITREQLRQLNEAMKYGMDRHDASVLAATYGGRGKQFNLAGVALGKPPELDMGGLVSFLPAGGFRIEDVPLNMRGVVQAASVLTSEALLTGQDAFPVDTDPRYQEAYGGRPTRENWSGAVGGGLKVSNDWSEYGGGYSYQGGGYGGNGGSGGAGGYGGSGGGFGGPGGGEGGPPDLQVRAWGKTGPLATRKALEKLNLASRSGYPAYAAARSAASLAPEAPLSQSELDSLGRSSMAIQQARNLTDIAGIYGWMSDRALFSWDQKGPVLGDAGAAYNYSTRFQNMFLGGLGSDLSEVGRRFLTRPERVETYNPVPNSIASWLPDHSTYFRDYAHGSPLISLPHGILRLPSEAYLRVHPQVKLMQTRASSLGKPVEQIMAGMLSLESLDTGNEDVLREGTEIHRKIQRKWQDMGILLGAEQRLYNEKLGMAGHYDAIIDTPEGPTVVDIKSVNERKFQHILETGQAYEEHAAQLSFYQHETGIHRGAIMYVSRDNPEDVMMVGSPYDEDRFNAGVQKVLTARKRLEKLVSRGLLGKGDLFDVVSRFEVLAAEAPWSPQYRMLKSQVANMNEEGLLGPDDRRRVEEAKERASEFKKRYQIHDYRFRDVHHLVKSRTVEIERIVDPNTFIAKGGDVIRFAGVQSSEERIEEQFGPTPEGMSTAEWGFQSLGMKVGNRVRITHSRDPDRQQADDLYGTYRSVVHHDLENVNQRMLQTGVGIEKETDWSPAGVLARFRGQQIARGAAWESFAHLGTPFHSKFLRSRSGLEQLERGIVYGKDTGSWDSPARDYLWPTLTSIASWNPVVGAAGGAAFASFFTPSRTNKIVAAKWGAVAGASLSVLRSIAEFGGTTWKPPRTRRREELEEYWDALKYVKYRGLAAWEAEQAKKLEGVDIESLMRQLYGQGRERQDVLRDLTDVKRHMKLFGDDEEYDTSDITLQEIQYNINKLAEQKGLGALGPHALRALAYRDEYRATLYAQDPGVTPFAYTLRAMPKYKRELVQSWISSSPEDRRRIYDLLPNAEKRALGLQLGVGKMMLPRRTNLRSFFRRNPLPDASWEGWSPDVDLEHLRIRAIRGEHLDPMESGVYELQVDEAERETQDIPVPIMHSGPSAGSLSSTLNQMLSGQGIQKLSIQVHEAPHDGVNHTVRVQMRLRQKRDHQLREALNIG